jgi:hypothetical protein
MTFPPSDLPPSFPPASFPPASVPPASFPSWRTRAVLRLSGRTQDLAPEQKSERAEARAVFRRFFKIITRAAAERGERKS